MSKHILVGYSISPVSKGQVKVTLKSTYNGKWCVAHKHSETWTVRLSHTIRSQEDKRNLVEYVTKLSQTQFGRSWLIPFYFTFA